MLSELPEYNDKISVAHAMTPSVILKYNHQLLLFLFKNIDAVNQFTVSSKITYYHFIIVWPFVSICNTLSTVQVWLKQNKLFELLPHTNPEWVEAMGVVCTQPLGRAWCRFVFYFLYGPSTLYFDELMRMTSNHIPAGASYRQFAHYAQIAVARKSIQSFFQ